MSPNTEQRKLAAIMFTDMVGYTALAQRDDQLALELLEEHRVLLRGLFPKFNGQEIKTIGDAFLVEFASALEAAQCAIEIQRALAKRNHDVGAGRRIELKIGIHIGDVVHRGGDVYGDGVNIASRIEPLAGAGGICISMDVERQIRNALETTFVKLGPTDLKNIKLPMELFRIVLPWDANKPEFDADKFRKRWVWIGRISGPVVAVIIIIVWWFVEHPGKDHQQLANPPPVAPATAALGPKSIAVLAFVNMSGDKDNEYFSDGITEEILNALARTPGLRVAARTSSFHFKGKDTSIPEIAKELGVAYIVEGSVRRAGNQLRITAQLINSADDSHIWSDTFDRKAEDIFALQTEVAQRIREVLQVKLLEQRETNGTVAGTDNLEAYDLYLRARDYWNKRTAIDLQHAIELSRQAVEKDPKFALAYALLASSYGLLPEYAAVPVREANPKARAAALQALQLDGTLAEPHAALANCAFSEWDWPGAQKEFQEALRLNPNYATAHQWYALLLQALDRKEDALAEIRLAHTLDPLSPVIQCAVSVVLECNHRLEEALVESEKAFKLAPDFQIGHVQRGSVLLEQGKLPEATAEFELVHKQTGDIPIILGNLGYVYARASRTNDALEIIAKLKKVSAAGGSAAGEISMVYQGLGDLDQTFVWLDSAAQSLEFDPRMLKDDPLAAEVVKDPRYAALLRKFGLTPLP